MLGTEVSEVTKPYARFWVGLTRRHPVAMPMADLVIYVAVVSLAWIFVGSTAGVAALVITLALYGFGVVRVLRSRSGRSS